MSTVAFANPKMALIDRTKGSVKNRLACTREHLNNHLKTTTGVALGTGAFAFAGHSIYKSGLKNLTNPDYLKMMEEAKGWDKVAAGAKYLYTQAQGKVVNLLKNPKIQEYVSKSDKWINDVTKGSLNKINKGFRAKGAKTGLAVAVVGTTIAVLAGLANHFYKKGQIDQKYTDKAKQEKASMAAQKLANSAKEYQTLAEKIATMKKADIEFLNNNKVDEYEAFMHSVVNARKY